MSELACNRCDLLADLMTFGEQSRAIFTASIRDYHVYDSTENEVQNPYPAGELPNLLYAKSWIDTVQWHLEDVIRHPQIRPEEALAYKRRIDISNQERTNVVEAIDSFFLHYFGHIEPAADARVNSESPAWALDRLSILALKIYHMGTESSREAASHEHRRSCSQKLEVLYVQQGDLVGSINELLEDIQAGRKYMKVYRQMKMYNDPGLNPVLYNAMKQK